MRTARPGGDGVTRPSADDQDAPEVNVREFALAVAMLINQWHRKPHEWMEQCACGERWPCKARDAWLAGAKAVSSMVDELERLRADADA